MKKSGYIVRVKEGSVSVTHRASVLGSIASASLGSLYLLVISVSDKHPGNAILTAFIFFLLMMWAFLAGISGEFMRCDRHELQFAGRKFLGRWRRTRIPVNEISGLCRAIRIAGRRSTYPVLSFQHNGQTVDLLSGISQTDTSKILEAGGALGIHLAPRDSSHLMIEDIEKRGWFVNPWKKEQTAESHDKQL